jgi:N,N-dimethylformamidase
MTYDPLQRFIQLVPGGNGIIYGVQADGNLMWFRHTGWQSGAVTWANSGAAVAIGSGWNQFATVLADQTGQLFGITAGGDVRWYKYNCTNLNTGAGSWAGGGAGPVIGSGFTFPHIFGGFDGVLYCIDATGNLWWFQYTAGDGQPGWANSGSAQQIGSGFHKLRRAWAEPSGVIYGVEENDSNLGWYRYLGSGTWANAGSVVTIGSGWGDGTQKTEFANGSGVIYTVSIDDDQVNGNDWNLNWYKLNNSQTVTPGSGGQWANGGGSILIGSGFSVEPTAALQGYAVAPSIRAGATQTIAVSTTFPNFTGSLVQVAPQPGNPVQVIAPTAYTGQLQVLPSGFRPQGCGWQAPMSFTAPTQSGIYAAELTAPAGTQFYATFTVTPSAPSAPLAFVMPLNTYHAYNTWAGHDRYTNQDNVNPVTVSFQRPSVTTQPVPAGVMDHTLYNDLFLLRWLASNGYEFDCYCDLDVDAGGWLASYKALILGGHPEYWTDQARANLKAYLTGGGRLVAPGGNNLYERMTYTAGRAAVTWTPVNNRDLFVNDGEPEAQIIGGVYNDNAYGTFEPYVVEDASHPLFAGTGVSNGTQFGQNGYNGAASGWEMNGPIDTGAVPGTVTLLAQGSGQSGNGAAMVYIQLSGGGWVWAANSIAFCGSLPQDATLQKLMKNVLAAATA